MVTDEAVDVAAVDSGAAADVAASPSVSEPVEKEAAPQSGEADPSKVEAAPAYAPNFKFKANQKEMEFDELVKPFVKTADVEKKLRELHEKAYGLDTIKPERDQLKNELTSVKGEYSSLQQGLDQLSFYVEKKDYDSFFGALNIPKADIMQYALLQLKLQENPEQRAAYEKSRAANLETYRLKQENERLQSTYEQQSASMRTQELNLALGRPDISQAAQAFDQRFGREGAFRDEVVKRGMLYYAQQGLDIGVDQAVNEVLTLAGLSPQAQQLAPQQSAPQASMQKKPVIPNIQGRSTSPAKKVYKSLDDLKSYARERINDVDSQA